MKCFAYEMEKLLRRRYLWVLLAASCLLFLFVLQIDPHMDSAAPLSTESVMTSVSEVIERAEKNMTRAGQVGADSYEMQYQQAVAARYRTVLEELSENLSERNGDEGSVLGWSEFFRGSYGTIFAAILLVVFVSEIFLRERATGFDSLLRLTKKGTHVTSAAKLILTVFVSVFLPLLFSAIQLLFVSTKFGLSSPRQMIQLVEGFPLSPHPHAIGSFLVRWMGTRCLAFLVWGMMIALLSVCFHRYAWTYLVCGALYGIFYRIRVADAFGKNAFLSLLDFHAALDGTPLFTRFWAVNVGGTLVPLPRLILSVLCAGILGLAAAVFFLSSRRGGPSRSGMTLRTSVAAFLRRAREKVGQRGKKPRVPSGGLFGCELYKLLGNKNALLLLFVILLKGMTTVSAFTPDNMVSDQIYYQYAARFGGVVTAETLREIEREQAELEGVIAGWSEVERRMTGGALSMEAYAEALEQYNAAMSHREPLRIVRNHVRYLLDKAETTGKEMRFFYDTGWKDYFDKGFDGCLYFLILYLASSAMACEYRGTSSNGAFLSLLRSTPNGRRKTYLAKLRALLVVTVTLSLFFQTVDWVVVHQSYPMEGLSARLFCIEQFAGMSAKWTVGGFCLCLAAVRLFAIVLLATMLYVLSYVVRKHYVVMLIGAAGTMLSHLLTLCGLSTWAVVDYTNFLHAVPLFVTGGTIWGYPLFFTLGTVLAAIIMGKVKT